MNVVGCGCLQKFMVSYFYVGNRGGNVWKNAGLHILLLSRLFTCFVWATSASRYVHTARIRNFLTNFQFLTKVRGFHDTDALWAHASRQGATCFQQLYVRSFMLVASSILSWI